MALSVPPKNEKGLKQSRLLSQESTLYRAVPGVKSLDTVQMESSQTVQIIPTRYYRGRCPR